MKKDFKAIIFDMDGVIVDTNNFHRNIEYAVCRKHKINISLSKWDSFRGLTYEAMYDYIIKNFGTRELSVSELTDESIKLTLKLAKTKVKAIPGALTFIKKSRNYFKKIALTTSNKKVFQTIIFSKFKLSPYFDTVVTGEDIKRGKPDPEPYLLTCDKLKIKPCKCVVIEDADNGIVSAKKAGCFTVGLATTFDKNRLLASGADLVVKDFKELSAKLEKDFI